MNILKEIAKYKQEEVAQDKKNFPVESLFKLIENLPPTREFIQNLKSSPNVAVIAEIKFVISFLDHGPAQAIGVTT